jgi:hypothetical protein
LALHIDLPVIVTINLYVVLTVSMTITGRSMCSVNSYCDNNGEVNMWC